MDQDLVSWSKTDNPAEQEKLSATILFGAIMQDLVSPSPSFREAELRK